MILEGQRQARSHLKFNPSWSHEWGPVHPNAEACLRLVRALAVETHENWLEAHRYLNTNDLREHKKTALRQTA